MEESFIYSFDYSAFVLILIHEVFIHPVIQRCIPPMESIRKVQIGVILHVIRVLALMVSDLKARHNFLSINGQNASIPCLWSVNATTNIFKDSMDYHWIAIPQFFYVTSLVMLYTGAIEFLCAQTPSFMKGLMSGGICCSMYPLWCFLCFLFHFIETCQFGAQRQSVVNSGMHCCYLLYR